MDTAFDNWEDAIAGVALACDNHVRKTNSQGMYTDLMGNVHGKELTETRTCRYVAPQILHSRI